MVDFKDEVLRPRLRFGFVWTLTRSVSEENER